MDVGAADLDAAGPPLDLCLDEVSAGPNEGEAQKERDEEDQLRLAPRVGNRPLVKRAD